MSNAPNSWKDTPVFPIGINIIEKIGEKISKIKVIAIHGNKINAFIIERHETTESPYAYAASSMYETTKISYELGARSCHNLLSDRYERKEMHYKYESPMQTEDAYELFTRIMSSLRKDNFKKVPAGFIQQTEYCSREINIMIDNAAENGRDFSSWLLEDEREYINIHPEDLSQAKLLLLENLRKYKIWGEQ
jgi:hypothetical protein